MLPRVDPILPVLSKTVPIGREWRYEPKLDGFRGMLYIENGRGSFASKTKKPMPRFQDLADELARGMKVRDAIFDGEIVVMGENGPDFNALFSRRGTPSYIAFDLLWLNGKDLRELSLVKRKARLQKLVASSPIVYTEAVDSPALFHAAAQMDLEGIVAKKRSDPYAPGTVWVKVKHAGYTQKEGRGEMFHRRA
jgi:bifunctional non-homologous end joining protein LigD